MWLVVLLLHSILFSLERSNRIILEYKTMRTTHTSHDSTKPSYNFIIYLKLAKKEVVESPITSFYFVQLKRCTRIILAYKTLRTTDVSLKLAKTEVVGSPITSFYFFQPQKVQSYYSRIQNDAYNSCFFKISKDRGG